MLSITKDHYHKEYPPFLKDNLDTKVKINLAIYSVGEIDELKMSFSLHFLLTLKWWVSHRSILSIANELSSL